MHSPSKCFIFLSILCQFLTMACISTGSVIMRYQKCSVKPQIPNNMDLLKLFCFSKVNTKHLCDDLEPYIEFESYQGQPLNCELQVRITLHYLATGCFQQTLAALLHVDQATISCVYWCIVWAITEAYSFALHHCQWYKVRLSWYLWYSWCERGIGLHTILKSRHLWSMLNNISITKDGTIVNVQSVCNAKFRIWNLVICWPGSIHDLQIFCHSGLNEQLINGTMWFYVTHSPFSWG